MLWMITDFSKYKRVEEAIVHISSCLESGAGKVTLRNSRFYSEKTIGDIKDALDGNFHDKEIFIHDPLDSEIEKYDHLHFPSRRMDESVTVKERFPEKKVAVSTHSSAEYEYVFSKSVEYAFFSPVFKPLSKGDDIRQTVFPVKMKNLYLLGGMDRMKAFSLIEKGFTNIAGISLFYNKRSANDVKQLSKLIMEKEYGSIHSN